MEYRVPLVSNIESFYNIESKKLWIYNMQNFQITALYFYFSIDQPYVIMPEVMLELKENFDRIYHKPIL